MPTRRLKTNLIFYSELDYSQKTMPSKIQEAEIEADEDMMEIPPELPERKEYLWSCDLEGKLLFGSKNLETFNEKIVNYT